MSLAGAVGAALFGLWSPLQVGNDFLAFRGAPPRSVGARDMVLVEHDGSPEAREDARFEQEWLDMAQTRRLERGEVVCSTYCQIGDKDIATAEARAFALLDLCHVALISDRTLGGLVGGLQVMSGTAQQLHDERAGVAVLVPFTVGYSAVLVLA